MKYLYGIDIGGTTVKMGLFGEDGTLHLEHGLKIMFFTQFHFQKHR